MLAQKQCDGTVRPVAYASRTLQPYEGNYGVTELEALGVVWVVKHFRHYLHSHQCDVFADHEALKTLHIPQGSWPGGVLALQEVNLSRPRRQNVLVDVLSWAPEEWDSRHQPPHLILLSHSSACYGISEGCHMITRELGSSLLCREQYLLLDGVLHVVRAAVESDRVGILYKDCLLKV